MVLKKSGPVVQKAARLGSEAGNLIKAVAAALEYLAKMLVQYMLEPAQAFPAVQHLSWRSLCSSKLQPFSSIWFSRIPAF